MLTMEKARIGREVFDEMRIGHIGLWQEGVGNLRAGDEEAGYPQFPGHGLAGFTLRLVRINRMARLWGARPSYHCVVYGMSCG